MSKQVRRTVTSPDVVRAWVKGEDLVTAVRTWGSTAGNREHELALDQLSFVCGTHPRCNVVVDDPQVSQRHADLERRGWRLKVTDLQSKNGTFLHGPYGKREPVFDVGPGEIFGLARSVTVLPMNEPMRRSRRRIVEVLGVDHRLTPDDLLIDARGSGNMVVVGENGCGHDRLALAVHAASVRRTLEPVEIDELPTDQAKLLELAARTTRSTLIIKVRAQPAKANRASLDLITSAQYQIRLIALAPTVAAAHKALGEELAGRARMVLLRPLRERVDELGQLFDQMLGARQNALRMHHLGEVHQDALRSYSWPNNLVELAAAVERIAALVPSLERPVPVKTAAAALGIGDKWLYEWLAKMGLSGFWESLRPESAGRRHSR